MSPHALLDHLAELGIAVEPRGDRLRCSPRSALTTDLISLIQRHKPAIMALLRQAADGTPADDPDWLIGEPDERPKPTETEPSEPVCRCRSTTWRDIVLRHDPHDGRSTRRDCDRCGRFLCFPYWYGAETGMEMRN